MISEIGKPHFYQFSYYLNTAPSSDNWRYKKSISYGGVILDMGYHMLDLIADLFEQPSDSKAFISYVEDYTANEKLEDSATIILKHSDFLHGSIALSRSSPFKKESIAIYGDKKTILADKRKISVISSSGKTEKTIEIRSSERSEELAMLNIYIKDIINKKVCIEHLKNNLNHMQCIKSIYESIH